MENHKKTGKKKLTTEDTENTEIKFDGLVGLFEQTQAAMQRQAARSVDIALVVRNWLFGWYIVEFENGGAKRAEMYGKELMKQLSCKLTETLGKGFSKRSLEQYRKFYLAYSEIAQALPAQSPGINKIQQALSVTFPETLQSAASKLTERFILGWTHYVTLLTVKNPRERRFYELEAAENGWGYRELERQINSALYERLALSRDKDEVKRLNAEGQIVENASDIIKSPYILEFTGLEERKSYSEYDLETALINKIEHFLLELGKGFLFESRQKRFSFDNRHFYVDLVFYNRLLRCYVVIDLKIGDLKHQDLGQMQMYVNYFDRYVKLKNEKPTVGILLCLTKSDELVELTLPADANIYASEYQLYLPDKEALKKQLEEAHAEWEETIEDSSVVRKSGNKKRSDNSKGGREVNCE
ncbi:PDDEXK nuclease domain-containing protein [Desulfobacter vibrioformis]|uniref:PDDEXK nuclease domain-containing protein n=1 Tax=Desulfobacter vibrioformis TaxID=34031 RepID=UPI0006909C03|nr:PDDEXK nuclease domain-containing protein [Desulfobacter vibrioformis]